MGYPVKIVPPNNYWFVKYQPRETSKKGDEKNKQRTTIVRIVPVHEKKFSSLPGCFTLGIICLAGLSLLLDTWGVPKKGMPTELNIIYKHCKRFSSLRVFRLLSSSLLLFPQRFGRYILRLSSGISLMIFVELGILRGTSRFDLYWNHGGRLFWFC